MTNLNRARRAGSTELSLPPASTGGPHAVPSTGRRAGAASAVRRCRAASLSIVILAVAAGCAPPPAAPPTGWSQVELTRDGHDATSITTAGPGSVRVSSPAHNSGSNSRHLFWRNSAAATRDHQACATTTHTGLPIQEGVALRLAASTNGAGTRGITVQKNIYAGVDWVYNVHLWDTAAPGAGGGGSVALLKSHDLGAAIAGTTGPSDPRRLCARVRDRIVELKVWRAVEAEPGWNDVEHVRSTPLPASWVYVGRPGFYIGHVPANGRADFTGMLEGAVG